MFISRNWWAKGNTFFASEKSRERCASEHFSERNQGNFGEKETCASDFFSHTFQSSHSNIFIALFDWFCDKLSCDVFRFVLSFFPTDFFSRWNVFAWDLQCMNFDVDYGWFFDEPFFVSVKSLIPNKNFWCNSGTTHRHLVLESLFLPFWRSKNNPWHFQMNFLAHSLSNRLMGLILKNVQRFN